MRIAVISDIHGNSHALSAVLADIESVGVDAVVNLGDLLSGPLAPAETAALLMAAKYPTIAGNHDVSLVDRAPEAMDAVDRFAAGRIDAATGAWLRQLPATMVVADELFLCHGTPTSNTEPWLDSWWRERDTTLPDEASVTAKAAGYEYPVLLCGHTHLSRIVRLRDGRLIVNPGAVGLQINHGAPDARYAVLEKRDGNWAASLRAVAYDHAAAAQLAIDNGFPKWAEALLTGWVGADGLFPRHGRD